MRLAPALQLLRLAILAYFAALFGLALWAAWSVLAAAVRAETCPDGGCPGRGAAALGDWIGAVGPVELAIAGATFTCTMIAGLALFALPWWGYRVWLQRTGRAPRA